MNLVKRKLAEGNLVLCMGLRQARSVDIVMIAAACGFDSIYVDLQHSPLSFETTSMLCVASIGIGITPLVRVPSHHGHDISRVLDGGALGVIAPNVNTPAEAEALVENTKFPPLGHRSVMGPCPSLAYRPLPLGDINNTLNEQTLLIAMIETPEAIQNVEAIAAVKGVDILLIGSNDLCAELGIPGQLRHPKLREAYEISAKACRLHNKFLGVGGIRRDIELHSDLVRMGARFIISGSDVTYLTAAARSDVEALRALSVDLSGGEIGRTR